MKNNKLSYRDKYLTILGKFPNIEKNSFNEEKNILKGNHLEDLINISIEIRKIEKKIHKIKQNNKDITIGLEFPIEKIYGILEENKIRLIDYTGKKYIDGMNGLDIISVEKNETQIDPIILDTITPMIEFDGVVLKRSKVIILSK